MDQPELSPVVVPDEASCAQVAARLLPALLGHLPDDRAFVVHLSGALGAGKTTFVRGVLRAAGVMGQIPSPTYTLVETYETPVAFFVHVDFYRLSGASDAEALGLREYDRPGAIWLVEWPERVTERGRNRDIGIVLVHRDTDRLLHVSAATAVGASVVAAWAPAGEVD
ncbi:MAG: tRNA (adenosine(37)-N6)-threonylcarbamoyltransferase complex ATPase subunit type 1 TsaE [Gammaproteobacteria bacterium]|nr:tRNA (adenosine(37)-N6)-threonylcarbamoyltransferase complex ATPase subunit type 1 TsaE [Gammaproteobacteria bacterium]MDH3767791.1 tRNA (adenosine(37)-N6)-threonylcarbamoyltransferase complex ATPase subunit type 1 TsaE [Gammaproteobacteria bacterium]